MQRCSLAFLFFSVLITYAILMIANKYILIDNDLYYQHFGEKLSYARITEMIQGKENIKWLTFSVSTLLRGLKLVLISFVLLAGCFLANKRTDFVQVFKIVIISEFVFVLQLFTKVIWFGVFHTHYDLVDVHNFSPLSLINFLDLLQLEFWQIYPLNLFNLFEALYVIALGYQLKTIIESDFSLSLKLVVVSYGSGLLIWVVFITFLTVSFGS